MSAVLVESLEDVSVNARYARARSRYLTAVEEFCTASEEVAMERAVYDAEFARRRKAGDDLSDYVPPGHWSYAELDRILRARSVTRW